VNGSTAPPITDISTMCRGVGVTFKIHRPYYRGGEKKKREREIRGSVYPRFDFDVIEK